MGFCRVDCGVPSPKVHCHDVGLLVDWSVKVTISDPQPSVALAVKLTTGAWANKTEIREGINANRVQNFFIIQVNLKKQLKHDNKICLMVVYMTTGRPKNKSIKLVRNPELKVISDIML